MAQDWLKWLVFSLLGLALSAPQIGCDYISISEKFGAEAVARCNEKCPFQNRTGDGHFDLSCGPDCSLQQCALGCSLWRRGLENSCQTSCNVSSETVFSRELYCVIGCNEALNSYFQKLRELIGTPPAPALVADSLTPNSLSLVWEAQDLGNLSYLVQWRYEELAPGTWQYYNGSHSDGSIIQVWNLRPYTKYRFRVSIFLNGRGGAGEPIFSAPSVVISTLESGRPTSPPSALRAAAPDPTRVAISWEPGPFPNGPLIGYVLRLGDSQPNVYAALKDMPASNNTFFYMFQNLSPSRQYEVSVAMRNAEGEGPRASVTVATPPMPASTPQQPTLVLGGSRAVLAAPASDMLADPVELFTTTHSVTGVGLDISRDYLFVSVSSGYVYRSSLTNKSDPIPILTPDTISYKPLDLSVDWLNEHLYVLGEVYYSKESDDLALYASWEILRCDFGGKNQLVALAGFSSRPIHFEVDPYNGYLFWALHGSDRGGLYRLALGDVSNGARRDAPPALIVRDPALGPFTVDHKDFRLLVAHPRRNNILAVSLDGREVTPCRSNTQAPMFGSARSLAYANGLFYWTDGTDVLAEEYHATSDSYYHNEYPVIYNMTKVATKTVLVNLRSCQPVPIPVNPPIQLQAVMGISKAKVSWLPPHLLGHQGNGAWQQWEYHLQLVQVATGEVIDRHGINVTNYVIEDLRPDSEYVVKVAAVTKSGSGPWSSEFVGKTLAATYRNLQSTLVWWGPEGLLQTDLMGDHLEVLIHRSQLKSLEITDVSWYRDRLYLVTNASSVMWYNTTTRAGGVLAGLGGARALAVDWVGRRLYWSNPKQQLISRADLDGGGREPVPLVTVARELAVDALQGYLYWNTGHAVEAARLTGDGKMVYYPAQLFSGRQVMGIAPDLDQRWLYWLVRSYDGSELHRAPTAEKLVHMTYDVSSSLVTRLSGAASGPLIVSSGRLCWRGGGGGGAWGGAVGGAMSGGGAISGGGALLADGEGRHAAALGPRVALAARDPVLHDLPDSLVAIPEPLDASSVSVVGSWSRFNVSWSPARRVSLPAARVLYDVSLYFSTHHKIEKTVDTPWLTVSSTSIPAYSRVEVTVRAHTAWGGAAAARAQRRTPEAAPPAPPRARLYLPRRTSGGAVAEFRWDAPATANGVIRGYLTQCWAGGSDRAGAGAVHNATLPPHTTRLTLSQLQPDAVYYFQVRAFTDAGFGPYSETVSISSDDIKPIPKVMISTQESIRIVDLDNEESELVPKSTGIPIDFAASVEENVVYWVNNLEEIFVARINGSGHYKLTSINGTASTLAADWVSRSVYWAQLEMAAAEAYVAYRADIGLPGARPRITRIFAAKQSVLGLQVVPLMRLLFWYEEGSHPGFGTLMTSSIDGSNITPFFNSTDSACNCPPSPQVARPYVIDMTSQPPTIYWVDPWVHQIIATDITACQCRVVVNATVNKLYGFTPMSVTVDSMYVYWFNSTEKVIYYTTKNFKSKIEQVKISHGYKIFALDPTNQPYPPKECLHPTSSELYPKVKSNSANSLTIQLPAIKKSESCSQVEYEMPLTEYTIFYHLQTKDNSCDRESCPFITTTEKEVVLKGLDSFTNYSVTLAATNYYGKLHDVDPIVGKAMVLQTAAEPPTPARDVSAAVLGPTLARVEWAAAPGLAYELHWRTGDQTANKFKEHNTFEVSEGRAADMTRLSPDTEYSVWVRARSAHSPEQADSPALRVHTAPLPPPLGLVKAMPYSLEVRWERPESYRVHSYTIEYTEASSNSWLPCSQATGVWVAAGLQPSIRYRFRLRLLYAPHAPPFYWPHDDQFTYETIGDVPGPPGALRASSVGERVLRARWAPAPARGSNVAIYRVWARSDKIEPARDNVTSDVSELLSGVQGELDDDVRERLRKEGLELLHNGTENYWVIGLDEISGRQWVWVQACNRVGCGRGSAPAPLDAAARAPPAPRAAALAAALAAAALLAVCVAAAALYPVYNSRSKKKCALAAGAAAAARRGPDVELATLRQLPIRHSANIIYNQGIHPPTDAELAALPHVRREQITLSKFLGSGAFGEVFQGAVRGRELQHTKVAVKTLRKGASEQEKTEFLQEAALMANFKHEHILRLVGVCLDNDPHYLLLELMEEGDLLTYLRAKRAALHTPESLTLLDLLNMCVDVAKGCRYLEEMHFVHRDLAARNCLVTHRNARRIVKIGDFGLARDVYKNDYYRKEGEGLLPVRWMAAECLVDGVFSAQSDVWAWGVLVGEVLSLGQQPFPGRTNRQVLAAVRAGLRPDRPPHCPDQLYDLLQKCWSYQPEQRPSFKTCLEVVTSLRDATPPGTPLAPPPPPHPAHYLTLLADVAMLNVTNPVCLPTHVDAVENRTYLLDENDNAFLDEDFSEQPESFLSEATPKYLELAQPSIDGYEVPRAPHLTPHRGLTPHPRLVRPLARTQSLRAPRTSATIVPLRSGTVNRASLCEGLAALTDDKTPF